MTAIADAPDDSTVAQFVQTVNDLQETIEIQAERITLLEQRRAHLREERVIETNLGGTEQ